MNVRADIAGSKLVVFKSPEHYIDVRRDTRYPSFSCIEVVRRGHVYLREMVHDAEAPELIVNLMRNCLR